MLGALGGAIVTAPTSLHSTALALVAYDLADDAWWAASDDDAGALFEARNAAGHAVHDAWIDEGGEPGACMTPTIRDAVKAYVETLCEHCDTNEADDGGELCRECAEVERQDQADFERSHSAWRLG